MKKKLFLIVLTIMIAVLVLTGCSNANDIFPTNEKANFVKGTTPFETLQEFVTAFPDRTSGNSTFQDGELVDKSKNAGKWISEQLRDMGYTTSYDDGLQSFTYTNPYLNRTETAYNVVYKKESSSNKKVVIGAHYDNVASLSINNMMFGGDGTYNNGVGITTLLELAKVLANVELPFDVEFVAFGAEETGNFGSLKYVNSQNNLEDIILMINFDRNAIGDKVYMYSSEAKTKHNKYFYQTAQNNNLPISQTPSFMHPSLMGNTTNNGLYINEAMLADSDVFLNRGINIVNFISMNFSEGASVENQGMGNISYTNQDNFANVVQRLGGENQAKTIIDRQINSAISVVYHAFMQKDFVSVMSTSKANAGFDGLLNAGIMSYTSLGIAGGVILILVILHFSLKPSTKIHDVYMDTIYGRVNMSTGKIDLNNQPQKPMDINDIFGDFNGGDTNQNGEQNNSGKNKDTDIFGDY